MIIQSVSSPPLATSTIRSVATEATSKVGNGVGATTETVSKDPQIQSTTSAKASDDQLKDVVKAVNDFVKPFNDTLLFSIDKDTGTTVVKVIDTETDEVIKQIPSEEMLALAKALDQLRGLLVKQKA